MVGIGHCANDVYSRGGELTHSIFKLSTVSRE